MNPNPRVAVAIICFFFALVAQSRGEVWSLGVGCPGSGTSFPSARFLASHSSGFTGSGSCTRTPTRFTQFDLTSHSGGVPRKSTFFGVHTGDVLILPPLLDFEASPIFTVATRCPALNKDLIWIYVKWGASTYALDTGLVIGAGTYQTTGGLTVTGRYDVDGNVAYSGDVPLPGSCASGVYQLNGVGDRSGSVYFNEFGSGVFMPQNERALFFFPQHPVDPTVDWGGKVFKGLVFDNISADNTRQVTVNADAAGTTLTIRPLVDAAIGTIDHDFEDTLVLTNVNHPEPGMLLGQLTRTGAGPGTGRFACVSKRDINVQIICAGESPGDASVPYTLSLVAEGLNVLGQPTPNSSRGNQNGFTSPLDLRLREANSFSPIRTTIAC